MKGGISPIHPEERSDMLDSAQTIVTQIFIMFLLMLVGLSLIHI